jgi:hypothetical protein
MRYSFSAEFLRVIPPETAFGDAWEALCFDLLAAEHGIAGLQRLNAPDSGIDILRRRQKTAIQCKSDERGSFGSLSAIDSVKSLEAANNVRSKIEWEDYHFATNANYTGSAVKAILERSTSLGIPNDNIEFLGPEYWNELCARHFARVQDRFDFRVTVTEEQVIEAFRKARYFDKYVQQYKDTIAGANFVLKVKNNWTPVELEFPFSPDLTVENCVDAVQELLGVSLEWTNFGDIGTSTGPSVSLTVDRRGQTFKQTIGEVQAANPEKDLVFWITLVWKDKTLDNGVSSQEALRRMRLMDFRTIERATVNEAERRSETLRRAERMVQGMIWSSARQLKNRDAILKNG